MSRIGVGRESLAEMLRSHGEDDLAEQVPTLTDDQMTRIQLRIDHAQRERERLYAVDVRPRWSSSGRTCC